MPRMSKKTPSPAGASVRAGGREAPGGPGAGSAAPEVRAGGTAGFPDLQELPGQVAALQRQLHEADEQIRETARQAAEARLQVQEFLEEREQATHELEEFRRQTRAAYQEFLDAQRELLRETLVGFQLARQEGEAAAAQAGDAGRLCQEANRYLHREFEERAEAQQRQFALAWVQLEQIIEHAHGAGLLAQSLRDGHREAVRELGESRRQGRVTPQQFHGEGKGVARRPNDEARRAGPPVAPPEVRNRLGVTVDPVVVVAEVLPGTPAEATGLAPGDVISAVNGTPVASGEALREMLQAAEGEAVALRVARGGLIDEWQARPDAPPEDAEFGEDGPHLGVTVDAGVVVAEVLPGTPAEAAGLTPGDVLCAVNDTPIFCGSKLSEVVAGLPERAEVTLRVSRGGDVYEGKARLDGRPAML